MQISAAAVEKRMGSLRKPKIELPSDSPSASGFSSKRSEIRIPDSGTPAFTTAVSTQVEVWKHPQSPSPDKRRKKLWSVHTAGDRFRQEGNASTGDSVDESRGQDAE